VVAVWLSFGAAVASLMLALSFLPVIADGEVTGTVHTLYASSGHLLLISISTGSGAFLCAGHITLYLNVGKACYWAMTTIVVLVRF